jgi:subtilisin family serine protease
VALHDLNLARGGVHLPEELMVWTQEGRAADLERTARALGCPVTRRVGRRPVFWLRCAPGLPLRDAIAGFARAGFHAEASWVETEDADDEVLPDDLGTLQWHHQNTGQTIDDVPGVPDADIQTTQAWATQVGRADVVIAILDTGILPSHEDVAPNLWRNADEDCVNGVDDDGNGYVDDCLGWDFGDEDNLADPSALPDEKPSGSSCPSHHGTFMAALAGARGNNGRGIAGVAWRASLMNLKKHPDATCVSTTSLSVASLLYAVDNGADVVAMSFSTSSASDNFAAALEVAQAADVVLTMSAGNGSSDVDANPRYPVYYDLDAQIVVANSDHTDALSPRSNYGAQRVDLAAPGADVYSATITTDDAYGVASGTSYSTPIVAGAAALIRSAHPGLSNTQIVAALREGARPLPALACVGGQPCVQTGARLDVRGALDRAAALAGPASVLTVERRLVFARDELDAEVLNPGDAAALSFLAHNAGGQDTPGVSMTAALDPPHPFLSLTGGAGDFGDLPAGATARALTTSEEPLIEVHPGCDTDLEVSLVLTFTSSDGSSWDDRVDLSVACAVDADADGLARPDDCDDGDASVSLPCDQACDAPLPAYLDADLDGLGGDALERTFCDLPPTGFSPDTGDCDDADPAVTVCDDAPILDPGPPGEQSPTMCASGGGGRAPSWVVLVVVLGVFGSRRGGRAGATQPTLADPADARLNGGSASPRRLRSGGCFTR